jgi:transcriptional regulator with XRE-family HTH domain
MLVVRLREAIADYQDRTGEKLTLRRLAGRLGMNESTLRGIASGNSTTLLTIEKIARVLGASALGMLEELPDVDRRQRGGRARKQ